MPTLHDPLIIVTDLDGSLLDHHTYRWQPAKSWLKRLQQQAIPLIICSSKTAAEIIPLQQQLGIANTPFIAENGALVQTYTPHGEPERHYTGKRYHDIHHHLMRLQQRSFHFTAFADLSTEEMARITGLTPHNAAQAQMREASEALIWRDSEAQFHHFTRLLAAKGLTVIQGGRFWHVMDQQSNKGAALTWLLSHLQQRHNTVFTTIGLGDSPNDAPMLEHVDFAVIIKGYSQSPVILQRQDREHAYRTTQYGPDGWCEGLDYFISAE